MSDWQLDGLPGDVRQEAENAAQREGLPLHRWLGLLIRETCDEEGVSTARELVRGAANDIAPNGANNGNGGRRLQPVVPPRPQAEPSRMPPPAQVQPPARAAAATPIVARQTDPSRQPNRAPPAAPTVPQPAPQQAPPAAVKLSPLSTAPSPTAAAAPGTIPRGMPPMPATSPMPTASRFATAEPRAATPKAEPAPATSFAVAPERGDDRLAALGKLVQSLRRNELSPIGEARLFLKLMTEHLASIGDITAVTGRTKDQVSRSLRLLGLSDRLRDLIDRGALSREQAFALLDADDPDTANPVVPPSGSRA